MTGGLAASPCFLFYHIYDGPNPKCDTSRFTVHCTLEKGAEAYYSGIRVIVIAKKIGYDDDFAKVEIRTHRRVIRVARKIVGVELSLEETSTVIDDHALSVNGLPLYTLILELVDLSDEEWFGAEIKFQAFAETSRPGALQQIPDTHKILYDHAKHTTENSPSCVLFLATKNIELWRHLKRCSLFLHDCPYPDRIGLPTHGFRILPPSKGRPLFTQPPLEILHHIFHNMKRNDGYPENWRKALIAVCLVCRAWWKVALCLIYEDFGRPSQEKVHIGRLVTALEDNPMWGRYIKRFSPYCFTGANTEAQFRRDALTILKTAPNMRHLLVKDVSAVLAGEFVKVFCKMAGLRIFAQLDEEFSEEKIYLNAAQLTKCFEHWPKLRRAMVYRFGQPHTGDGNEFDSAKCALHQISFQHGFVSMGQLRAITASSQDTLHTVFLGYITGISNKELTSWLYDFGPNLTSLTLMYNVFTCSEAEELAVDATIHKMSKLSYLKINGTVATVLTLLRFEPSQELEGQVYIFDSVLFDRHALAKVLRTTKWKTVSVGGFVMSDEGPGFIGEAERVAEERGIKLRMW